jgi:LysM repeat protein
MGSIRRALSLPFAVVSTVAVTLGIAHPAEAAPQPPKRQAKARTHSTGVRTAQATPMTAPPTEYTVVDGDTVSGIAEQFGLATAEVLAHNGLSWSSLIFPGQRLALPGGSPSQVPAAGPPPDIAKHVVVEGDTIIGIAAAYGLDAASVLSVNGLGPSSLIFPGESIVLPLTGTAPDAATSAAAPLPESQPDAPGSTPDTTNMLPVASVTMPLDDEMRSNVRLIIEVGRSLGVPDRGVIIALAAAAQESGLKNVHHGDRDSQGLFQQRPSRGWGTIDQILDPVRATHAFYGGDANPNAGRTRGLLDIPGWETMSVTQAAQAVQLSAHPDHFAKWETAAAAWLSELG